jgi:hypothetical protein
MKQYVKSSYYDREYAWLQPDDEKSEQLECEMDIKFEHVRLEISEDGNDIEAPNLKFEPYYDEEFDLEIEDANQVEEDFWDAFADLSDDLYPSEDGVYDVSCELVKEYLVDVPIKPPTPWNPNTFDETLYEPSLVEFTSRPFFSKFEATKER